MLACESHPKKQEPNLASVPRNMVKMLIDQAADVHATDRRGCNALHLAMQFQQPDILITKLLLQSGIDANLTDSQGYTPLHYFSTDFGNGRVDPRMEEMFNLLLAYSDPGAENCDGDRDTPLLLAIESGNWQAFHLLLAKGAILRTTRPTIMDDLLMKATQALQPKAVEILLAHGASPIIKAHGIRPMGHIALEGLLDSTGCIALPLPFEAFKSILKIYIDGGLDINTANTTNQSLLHVVAARAKEPYESALARYLIDVGADVYQPICGAWDAFLLAAVHGKLSVLRVLIAHADRTPDLKHWIHGRCSTPHVTVARNCIAKRLNSKAQSHSERLDHPVGDDGIEIVCTSLARHNLIDSKDFEGVSPLQGAVGFGNAYTVSKLLFHGADLHVTDQYGWTVLHTATYRKDEVMVRLLLQADSDVRAPSQQWAHQWGRPSLLYQGDKWKGTPLHLAAMFGQPTIVELLLQYGADVHADTDVVNCRPGHGPTALHIALDTGTFYGTRDNLCPEMLRVAEILVENGAAVEGVADHITLNEVPRFEGFEGLWEKLRKGITRNEAEFMSAPVG
jgi:ankyrin repeat protein